MILDAIAIDDERFALDDFLAEVKPIVTLKVIASFFSISDALIFLNTQRHVNFIFSDIEMPGISGIDGGAVLSMYCDKLIYTTGHDKYAFAAFKAGGQGYLMKPVQMGEVIALVDNLAKVKANTTSKVTRLPAFLKVKSLRDGTSLSLAVSEIRSITTCGNYVELQTRKQRFSYYAPLVEMKRMLCENGEFLSINHSCIVAANAIVTVENHVVRLENGEEYKVSRAQRGLLYQYFDEK